MNDSAPTPSHQDGTDAWMRHYAAAAERRRAAAARHRQEPRPYLRYKQREARWAFVIAVMAAALMAAWVYLVK